MQEEISEDGDAARAIRIRRTAPEDGLPHFSLAKRFKQCRDVGSHGSLHTFSACEFFTFCSLSTSSSPSGVSEIPKCGSGRGAGPSIFIPSGLNLLP